MNRKNLKIGVIFDQHAGVGGGYQQSINAALLANKLSNDSIDVIFFTTFKENIKLLSTFGIKAHLLNISFIDKFFSSFKRILNHPFNDVREKFISRKDLYEITDDNMASEYKKPLKNIYNPELSWFKMLNRIF